MYTAEMARENAEHIENVLDKRIREEVAAQSRLGFNRGSIRVYIDDAFVHTIREELEKRNFTVEHVPDIILKGDVDFSW